MRQYTSLHKLFLTYPVNTTMYLINRGPSVLIAFKILEKECQGHVILLKHQKVFVCVSYVKFKDLEREREREGGRQRSVPLQDTSSMTHGTTYGITKIKKVFRSWDVVFNENALHKDEMLYTRMKQQKTLVVRNNQKMKFDLSQKKSHMTTL